MSMLPSNTSPKVEGWKVIYYFLHNYFVL